MYIIFMEDDTSVMPPILRGFLAVPINPDGTYRWVRDVRQAYQYDSRDLATTVLLGDSRFKVDDTVKGARILEYAKVLVDAHDEAARYGLRSE